MAQQFGIAPKQLNSLIYTGPDIHLVPITEADRAPNNNTDTKYPIDCLWRDTVTRTLYWLSGFSAGAALWVPLGGGSGNLNTLTDTAGNVVLPVGANIQLRSITGSLVIAKNGNGRIDFSISNAIIGGTVITVDNAIADAITFSLGSVEGTYQINCRVSAIATVGGPLGAGYELVGTVSTDGISSRVIGTVDKTVNEEGILGGNPGSDANIVVSGNDAIVRVLGTTGTTIKWRAELTYTFVSVVS